GNRLVRAGGCSTHAIRVDSGAASQRDGVAVEGGGFKVRVAGLVHTDVQSRATIHGDGVAAAQCIDDDITVDVARGAGLDDAALQQDATGEAAGDGWVGVGRIGTEKEG